MTMHKDPATKSCSSEAYRTWLEIAITHEYYNSGALPVEVVPTDTTKTVFSKYGILFLRKEPGRWHALCLSDKDERLNISSATRILSFKVRPVSEEFHYVTEPNVFTGELFELKPSTERGVWRVLEVPLTEQVNDSVKLELNLDSVAKRLEFIFISRYNSPEIRLNLTEASGRLSFVGPEKIPDIDGLSACRFITPQAVHLSDSDPCKIQLWELCDKGQRLLCGNVPFPRPDVISMTDPKESITTYFYY